MPDWMKPFQVASDILQKPQSIATGILGEVTGSSDSARHFIDQYERALVDDTPENAVRYKAALASVGDSRDSEAGPGGITNLSSIVGGAVRGARNNLRPSDIAVADTGDASSLGSKIMQPATNLLIDPMLVVGSGGGVPKILEGSKAGKLLGAAGTVGKLGEGASKAEHAAQLARRLYQGTLVSGGDPLMAIGAAAGIGTAERAGSALLGRLGGKVAEDLVGEGSEKVLSKLGAEEMEDQYEAALRTLRQNMPEARTIDPAVGAQGDGFNIPGMEAARPPMPSREMELFQRAPQPTAADLQALPSGQRMLGAGPPVRAQGMAEPLALNPGMQPALQAGQATAMPSGPRPMGAAQGWEPPAPVIREPMPEAFAPVEAPSVASPNVGPTGDLAQQIRYWKLRAIRGDKVAEQKYLELLDMQEEDPVAKVVRLLQG